VIASNISSVLVFNIAGQTPSTISLSGNAMPLSAALTPDGTLLYVGANDGTVHVVSTQAGGDIQQISFPEGLCKNSAGLPFGIACNPDLIAVKP
jgi:DNA-binding beta-propeller fold protein YncE